MLQNPCKILGFKKNMVYEIPPGGGGKPYPASGLILSETEKYTNSGNFQSVSSRGKYILVMNNCKKPLILLYNLRKDESAISVKILHEALFSCIHTL